MEDFSRREVQSIWKGMHLFQGITEKQDTRCKDFSSLNSFIFSLHILQECSYSGHYWLDSELTAFISCGQQKSYHRKTMSVINSYFWRVKKENKVKKSCIVGRSLM